MKIDWSSKYVVFFAILIVGVAIDQWTKWYASERLATYRPGHVEHTITLQSPDDAEPMSVRELVGREFTANTPAELDRIADNYVRGPNGTLLDADQTVEPGSRIVVEHRKVTVIDGYWDFEYTVNPGAAFGLLSDSESDYRLPFFVVVSLLAISVILYLLRGVHPSQKLLVVALSLIGTGAMGNFIDRIRFGHVIDFVVWKYTDQYRWPTFNVADAFISVGVALMLIEIFRAEVEPAADEVPGDETAE